MRILPLQFCRDLHCAVLFWWVALRKQQGRAGGCRRAPQAIKLNCKAGSAFKMRFLVNIYNGMLKVFPGQHRLCRWQLRCRRATWSAWRRQPLKRRHSFLLAFTAQGKGSSLPTPAILPAVSKLPTAPAEVPNTLTAPHAHEAPTTGSRTPTTALPQATATPAIIRQSAQWLRNLTSCNNHHEQALGSTTLLFEVFALSICFLSPVQSSTTGFTSPHTRHLHELEPAQLSLRPLHPPSWRSLTKTTFPTSRGTVNKTTTPVRVLLHRTI